MTIFEKAIEKVSCEQKGETYAEKNKKYKTRKKRLYKRIEEVKTINNNEMFEKNEYFIVF